MTEKGVRSNRHAEKRNDHESRQGYGDFMPGLHILPAGSHAELRAIRTMNQMSLSLDEWSCRTVSSGDIGKLGYMYPVPQYGESP